MLPPREELKAFAEVISLLLVGLVIVGFLIRRDWRHIKRGQPIKLWYSREKLYPDDLLYDYYMIGYMGPYCVLFALLAFFIMLVSFLTFSYPAHP
jgi:hypothetical protein